MFGTKVAHNPKVCCNFRPIDQVQGHVIINIILNNKNFIRSTSIRRYMLIPLGSLKFISVSYDSEVCQSVHDVLIIKFKCIVLYKEKNN